MIILTRAQRVALKRVYDRPVTTFATHGQTIKGTRGTYREFRKTAQPGSGCIMVAWCGMWLGIEPDGYTHS